MIQSTSMDLAQVQMMALKQLPQISQHHEKPKRNRFARKNVKRFVRENVARLMRLEATDEQIEEALIEFLVQIQEIMPFDDFFFDEDLHKPLFDGELNDPDPINFNGCSVAQVSPLVHEAMSTGLHDEENLLTLAKQHEDATPEELTSREAKFYREQVCRDACGVAQELREKIAQMLCVNSYQVALTRNAGEAAALAAAMSKTPKREGSEHEDPIVFGDDTHMATLINMLLVGDAGNATGRDPFTAVPLAFATRGKQYTEEDVNRRLGQNSFLTMAIRGKSLKQIENEIKRRFKDYHPKTVVLTHVDSATGIINDLHTIGGMLKEHAMQPTVITDGAMAFGGIDVDCNKLFTTSSYAEHIGAVDMYLGTTGKAFGGPSVGFLASSSYTASQGAERIQKAGKGLLILHGMFEKSQNVEPTVLECLSKGDLLGALMAFHELENYRPGLVDARHRDLTGKARDMSLHEVIQSRELARSYFKDELSKAFAGDIRMEFLEAKEEEDQATHILTVRFPDMDMRALAQRLQTHQHVFATYKSSHDALRIGIDKNLGLSRETTEQYNMHKEGKQYISDAMERIVEEVAAMKRDGLVADPPTPRKMKASKKKANRRAVKKRSKT